MTVAVPLGSLRDRFERAGQSVLAYLREQLPMQLWTITRVVGDDWILLRLDDQGYGLKQNTVLRWSDSFCSRMIAGQGPRFSPDVSAVPAYLAAPVGQIVDIGAYVGVPLRLPEGELFGTLCGIDPSPQIPLAREQEKLVELLAELLSVLISAEREMLDFGQRAQQALELALTDALTGLANRRGWQSFMDELEVRLRRLAEPACVIVVDLDGLKACNDSQGHAAGDQLIKRAAQALRDGVRPSDFVARLGGDEFGVLAIGLDRMATDGMVARLRLTLSEAGVAASIGSAIRRQDRPLSEAVALADRRMYQDKQRRRR